MDEVFETRKQIDLLTKKNNQIVHVARQLITIINQTNEHSRRINEHINSIQTYVSKVAHQISATQRKLDSNNRRFNILSATVATDRALALFETTHHLWLRQQDLYDRQRAALELGYLTEYILPAKHLQNIFNLAAKSDSMARPLNGTILILLYIPCGKMIAYLFSAQTCHLLIVTCICVIAYKLGLSPATLLNF